MEVTVIGVYPVDEAEEPCHLIEVAVSGRGRFEPGMCTQESPCVPEENWQVPWDEHLLTADGARGTPLGPGTTVDIAGEVRFVFFFHYLDPAAPLRTPAGRAPLPPAAPRPDRLVFMSYEPPC
jgi:hypothetical protein